MINPFDEAHYNEHNRSNEEAVVYSVDKNTNIDIQTINFTSTLSVGFIETIASSPFATIRTENEAYATEYNLALKYLRLGLGLEKAILMKRFRIVSVLSLRTYYIFSDYCFIVKWFLEMLATTQMSRRLGIL